MEVYSHAKDLCSRLDLQFQFPARDNRPDQDVTTCRFALLDLPDVLLAASIVLATTFHFPPDNVQRYPRRGKDSLVMRMDWEAWQAEFPRPAERNDGVDFEQLKPNDVTSMSAEGIAEFLDWFQETQVALNDRDGTLICGNQLRQDIHADNTRRRDGH